MPAFAQDGSVTHDDLWWFHSGNCAICAGDLKLVSEGNEGDWELYDLSRDRCESKNLVLEQPEQVRRLAQLWQSRLNEFRELAGPPDKK